MYESGKLIINDKYSTNLILCVVLDVVLHTKILVSREKTTIADDLFVNRHTHLTIDAARGVL